MNAENLPVPERRPRAVGSTGAVGGGRAWRREWRARHWPRARASTTVVAVESPPEAEPQALGKRTREDAPDGRPRKRPFWPDL